jgi:CheY-like chemotaxis protein
VHGSDGHRLRSGSASSLRGVRVLVADDHAAFRESLRDHLAGWGLNAEVAADGREAIDRMTRAAAEGRPYRVAVLDLVMPGVGGDEVAQVARNDPRLTRTALLMVTSMDRSFDAE